MSSGGMERVLYYSFAAFATTVTIVVAHQNPNWTAKLSLLFVGIVFCIVVAADLKNRYLQTAMEQSGGDADVEM